MLAIRAKICAVVRAPGYSRGLPVRFRGFCGQRNASHRLQHRWPDRRSRSSGSHRGLVRSAPRARRRCVRAMVRAPLARADERGENTGDTGGGRLNVLPDGW